MTRTLTATAMMALAITANADYTPTVAEYCGTLQGMAETLMDARQRGVPASRAMEIMGTDELGRLMVIEAYQMPAFRTDEHQQRIVREFGDSWYIRCMTEVE